MAATHWIVLSICAILNVVVFTSGNSNLCTYFGGGRFPKEAYSLSNCTWYRENACCERTEVASVFREMPALLTNDQGCYDRMNYLMCYFCSPKQNLWFNQTLSICQSYCEQLFSHCGSAKYNEYTLADKYKDGVAFCEALVFNIVPADVENTQNCFQFDANLFGSGRRTASRKWLLTSVFLSAVYIFWNNCP